MKKPTREKVGGVVQKGCPAFHRLQDAAFPLDAQRLRYNPFPLSDESSTRDSD